MAAPSILTLELELDLFSGPFDLLLALVLRDAVDLGEVPIAEICVAYLERLAADEDVDLEAASEFLVLVASLCELKSRLLLPGGEDDLPLSAEEAADELAVRLAEYARVRAGAAWLAARRAELGRRLHRVGPAPLAPPRPIVRPLPAEDPERLREAIGRLLEPPRRVDLSHLPRRSLPVRVFLDRLRQLLAERGTFTFDEAVVGLDRLGQAVAFWALLELYRRGEARLVQAEPFGTIRVARASALGRPRAAPAVGARVGEEAVA